MQILIHTRRWIRLLIFVTLLGDGLGTAQTLTAPEYKIKAAFLYNFAVLTEWPGHAFASDETPLIIGVLGKNPFGEFLEETLKRKTVYGREIILKKYERATEVKDCHLLFVSTSDQQRVAEIISSLDARPILTVGESEAFQEAGGMIRLFKEKDEIRFFINRAAGQRAGLKFSSKLLALGKEIPFKPTANQEHAPIP